MLFLARHGETTWNKEQRLQGARDIPLSSVGIEQAKLLAENLSRFSLDTIIASNLKRAYQTAAIVGKRLGVPVEKEPGFNEQSYGIFEGRLWPAVQKELAARHETIDMYTEPPTDFVSRVIGTFTSTLKTHKNQHILIVCHGGVLRILLHHLRKTPPAKGHIGYELPNGLAYMFRKGKSGWVEEDFVSTSWN